MPTPATSRTVGLMVTCLVDHFRPSVAFATAQQLERAGYAVVVPPQSCCGQPNLNSGDRDGARRLARQVVELFGGFDWIVVPSGSCAATLKLHYADLFSAEPAYAERAARLAARTFELTTFLREVAGYESVHASWPGTVTYHDSCSGLRELGIKAAPRAALGRVQGLKLVEGREAETCCGFGGTFCMKFPAVANRMTGKKVADLQATGADAVVGGDLGCLLAIEGCLHRDGRPIRALHVAEILAGLADRDDHGG